MKLKIEKILKPLELKDYAPEYGDASLMVWINPPRAMREKLNELYAEFRQKTLKQSKREVEVSQDKSVLKKELDEYKAFIKDWNHRVQEWYVQIWSQGVADTHWSVEELEEIDQADPKLMAWMLTRTQELLDVKKG